MVSARVLAATFSAMWISGYVVIIDLEADVLLISGGCMAICITQVILCVFVIGLSIRKL